MTPPDRLPVALMFPGHGVQHPAMVAGLYQHEPVFTATVDEIFALLGEEGGAAREHWLSGADLFEAGTTARSQLLLFTVEYALGRMVLSWGVRPAALIGHSMGEFVAATLAGVFDLADAARLVHDRVRHWAHAPRGGMAAVAASAAELRPYLRDDVVVGAVNAPRQTVLAGPRPALDTVVRELTVDGHTVRVIPAQAPFHSPALAPATARARPLFAALRPRPPRMRVYSACAGAELRPPQAVDPLFWAGQPAAPVHFWPALDAMLAAGPKLLCDVGPGCGLATVARQHPSVARGDSRVLSLLLAEPGLRDERESIRIAADRLRRRGSGPLPA